MISLRHVLAISLVLLLNSCTYLKHSAAQARYTEIQNTSPSQVNLKHMLDRDNFFVLGKATDSERRYSGVSMVIAAYSNKYKANERVDTMFFEGPGTHYGLTLPAGDYIFLAYADINNDQIFDLTEIVGQREILITKEAYPNKVVKAFDLHLSQTSAAPWAEKIAAPIKTLSRPSLYYPQGTIRQLDDPIFDHNISTLGMYDPASFLEYAPTMFYALEEDRNHKIPIVFVHGIDGSARSFGPMIKNIDRDRYRLWFFHYPSGGDLDQLSSLFYDLFLSGEVVPLNDMPIIVVAHSMGGLVVRQAINKYQGNSIENQLSLFVSIASPFGGHPAAEMGEKHGLISLPAWQDLNPNSPFIKNLFGKPLPKFVDHQLYYAYKNSSTFKISDNSDGVVPLFSQLRAEAQQQSQQKFGFNSGHTEILTNQKMINRFEQEIAEISSIFPESHMAILKNGGFDVQLNKQYSPTTQHLIGYAGKYLVLLVEGLIEPFHPQQTSFIKAVRGSNTPNQELAREFSLFLKEHPELVRKTLREYGNTQSAG